MKKNYLNNKDMMIEIAKSKKQGEMNAEFANMMMTLVDKFGKHPSYAQYTYNDDMRVYDLLSLVRVWHNFDEPRFDKPFP